MAASLHAARPAAIHGFALAFLAQALIEFGWQLHHRAELAAQLAPWLGEAPGADALIVLICARLSIALIPVALVWLAGAWIARILVPLMVLADALPALETLLDRGPGHYPAPLWVAQALSLLAAALLFTPGARRWFAGRRGRPGLAAR